MSNFITGIDDFGTMKGVSQGWTFVSFDEVFYEDFQSDAQDILSRSKLPSFHAKEFKRKKRSHYIDFLNLIRDTLSKGDSSVACATLLDESWKLDFREFTDRVVEGAFKNAGITDEKLVSGSQFLAKPIFTYFRVASSNINASSTKIHIDHHALANGFNDIDLIVKNHKISPQLPIVSALNAYRNRQFSDAPMVEQNSIEILPDEQSFIIQAADMIGNFSAALVFKVLGKASKTNDLKAEIMNDVFGNLMDTSKITEMVEISGDDFVLKQSGTFSFTVS